MKAPNAMEQTAMAMPGLGGPANEAPSPIAPAADRDQRTAVGRGQVVATYAAAVTPTSVAASPWYAMKGDLAAVAQERETGQPGEHRDRHAARGPGGATDPFEQDVHGEEQRGCSTQRDEPGELSGTERGRDERDDEEHRGDRAGELDQGAADGSRFDTACGAATATVRFEVDVDVAFRREAVGLGADPAWAPPSGGRPRSLGRLPVWAASSLRALHAWS